MHRWWYCISSPPHLQNDVKGLIEGKSEKEIASLEHEITVQLSEGEGMDVDYWNAVLSLLRVASYKCVLQREQRRFIGSRDVEVIALSLLISRNNDDCRQNANGWRN